jgi:hypothetical protein
MKITIEDYNGNTVLTLDYAINNNKIGHTELGKEIEERDLGFCVADIDEEEGLRLQYNEETGDTVKALLLNDNLIKALNTLILYKF